MKESVTRGHAHACLSKSRLPALRQCERRLWLELHLDTLAMVRLWKFFSGKKKPGDLKQRIVQNGELVERILASAGELRGPMPAGSLSPGSTR